MDGGSRRVLAHDVERELVLKKSRFLTTLARVGSLEEATARIAAIRKVHWQATHNCTAMVVGAGAEVQRSSDDGEPAGTAGIPMLEVLRGWGLTDTLAVVTRYFGGVKLGAGGLVRAYSGAVSDAVAQATVLELVPALRLRIHLPADQAGRAEHRLREWDSAALRLLHMDYAASTAHVVVPRTQVRAVMAALADAGSGRWTAHEEGACTVEVPVGPGTGDVGAVP